MYVDYNMKTPIKFQSDIRENVSKNRPIWFAMAALFPRKASKNLYAIYFRSKIVTV